jgi:hypothetical protein
VDSKFHKGVGCRAIVLWNSLSEKLQGVRLSDVDDSVQWALEKDGVFSTKSLYKYLSFGGEK